MDKPRSTYVPLTEKEVDEARAQIHGLLPEGDLAHEEIDRLCDMAVNSLLYGQEIDRLRSTVPEVSRNDIIEECAKVCDRYYKHKHEAMLALAKKERFGSADDAGAKSVGARECATIIRALKG